MTEIGEFIATSLTETGVDAFGLTTPAVPTVPIYVVLTPMRW